MPVARTMAERQVGNMRYSPGVLAAAGLFPGPLCFPKDASSGCSGQPENPDGICAVSAFGGKSLPST